METQQQQPQMQQRSASFDLPLRNYSSRIGVLNSRLMSLPPSQRRPPAQRPQPQLRLGAPEDMKRYQDSYGLMSPQTPSAMLACEFEEEGHEDRKMRFFSAEDLVQEQTYARRPQQNHAFQNEPRHQYTHSLTTTPTTMPSQVELRIEPITRAQTIATMPPPLTSPPLTSPPLDPPNDRKHNRRTLESRTELLMENRRLQKRIAELEQAEQDLSRANFRLTKEKQSMLVGKQDLYSQYSSLKQHYEVQRQKWKEEYIQMESIYETRIKDLQGQVIEQENELARFKQSLSPSAPPVVLHSQAPAQAPRGGGPYHVEVYDEDSDHISSGEEDEDEAVDVQFALEPPIHQHMSNWV